MYSRKENKQDNSCTMHKIWKTFEYSEYVSAKFMFTYNNNNNKITK